MSTARGSPISTAVSRSPSPEPGGKIANGMSCHAAAQRSTGMPSSSTITLDVVMAKDKSNEKRNILVMRLFIVFFILLSAVIAYLKDTYNFSMIAQMMGVSWGALAGAFLAPFLYGLYWKRTTVPAVVTSFVFGVSLTTVMLLKSLGVIALPAGGFIGLVFKTSLHCGVFAMVGGLILVPLVSLLTRKPDGEFVDGIFKCYDRTVMVNVKKSIGDGK